MPSGPREHPDRLRSGASVAGTSSWRWAAASTARIRRPLEQRRPAPGRGRRAGRARGRPRTGMGRLDDARRLGRRTSHVRLGCLVSGVAYRDPPLMVRMATALDHASGGRAVLGLGAGWHATEHATFGYDYPSSDSGSTASSRDDARQMLDDEAAHLEGRGSSPAGRATGRRAQPACRSSSAAAASVGPFRSSPAALTSGTARATRHVRPQVRRPRRALPGRGSRPVVDRTHGRPATALIRAIGPRPRGCWPTASSVTAWARPMRPWPPASRRSSGRSERSRWSWLATTRRGRPKSSSTGRRPRTRTRSSRSRAPSARPSTRSPSAVVG